MSEWTNGAPSGPGRGFGRRGALELNSSSTEQSLTPVTGAGQLMQPTYEMHSAVQWSSSGYSSSQVLPLLGWKDPSDMGHIVGSPHSSGH